MSSTVRDLPPTVQEPRCVQLYGDDVVHTNYGMGVRGIKLQQRNVVSYVVRIGILLPSQKSSATNQVRYLGITSNQAKESRNNN